MQNLTHYCVSLVLLVASSFLYEMATERFLAPPKVSSVRIESRGPSGVNESIEDLFPEGAWQLGNCKRLQTDAGVLLFGNWKQISEDEWKLWPICLVVGRGMSGELDPEPVIMEAPKGAELKFTESLDIFSGGAPPIDRGRLIGNVRVHRQDKKSKQSFSLYTSNVGINSRKIWTTEAIEMRFGKAKMVGRDLTLFLASVAGQESVGGSINHILDRLELTYLDEFTLPLERGPLWKRESHDPSKPHRLPSTRQSSPMPAMVKIKCGGRVDYDFQLDQLSLRDAISLTHFVPGGVQDRFDCQALDLSLRNPYDDTRKRTSPLDWIARITATGIPASADLPSMQVGIKAERIEFDAIDGLVSAGGRGGVEVYRGDIGARLEQLNYQYDPARPKAIGAVDALGSGIVKLANDDATLREFRWQKGLRMRAVNSPPGARTLDVPIEFWVDGNIQAFFRDGGQFSAQAIEGVLKPQRDSDSDVSMTNEPVGKNESKFPKLMPERIQASGNVKVDTAALTAQTQMLRLFFKPADTPGEAGRQRESSRSPDTLRQWVSQPSADQDFVKPVAKPHPIVRGNLVSAQLILHPDGPIANDLSVSGDVSVEHTIKAGDQALPAKLTGQQLRISNETGKELIQLGSGVAAPARLEIGDGYFVGPMIKIWPADNFVQIRGAGEFQMPRAVMPKALMADDPERITWNRPPHCKWQGELRFNGREAHLTKGVEIEAEMLDRLVPWYVHMQGEQLQLVLSEEVRVDEMHSMRNASLQQITMHQSADHPVIISAERGARDGVLEARHVLHAPQLTLMPNDGGKLLGLGPGWYRSWFYAPASGPFATSDVSNDPNDRRLTGLHLIYREALEGNLENKRLSFVRGVRVGIKALKDWQASFDAAELRDLSVDESTLDCDQLSVGMTPGFDESLRVPGMSTPWELEAKDGVVFRTRGENGLLEGAGTRAVYSSGKDLFTIQGSANRGADIRHTQANGQPGISAVFNEITIQPKTFEVKHSSVQSINLGTLPSNR